MKKFESFHHRSTNSHTVSSKQSTGLVTRSMTEVATTTITKRIVVTASLQSCNNTDSNMHDRVSKIPFVEFLNGKFVLKLKVKPQSPFFEVEDYYSSDSIAPSLRKTVFSQSEAESSHAVIMHAIMIKPINFEEELASACLLYTSPSPRD